MRIRHINLILQIILVISILAACGITSNKPYSSLFPKEFKKISLGSDLSEVVEIVKRKEKKWKVVSSDQKGVELELIHYSDEKLFHRMYFQADYSEKVKKISGFCYDGSEDYYNELKGSIKGKNLIYSSEEGIWPSFNFTSNSEGYDDYIFTIIYRGASHTRGYKCDISFDLVLQDRPPNYKKETKKKEKPNKKKKTKTNKEIYNSLDVDEFAEFQGQGIDHFRSYLNENIDYSKIVPCENDTKVFVNFTVDENGNVTNPTLAGSQNEPSLEKEAIRLISSSLKWSPAKVDEEPVKVRYYNISVEFKSN